MRPREKLGVVTHHERGELLAQASWSRATARPKATRALGSLCRGFHDIEALTEP